MVINTSTSAILWSLWKTQNWLFSGQVLERCEDGDASRRENVERMGECYTIKDVSNMDKLMTKLEEALKT